MSLPLRTSSLEPVQIPGWRWQPFLDTAVAALAPLQPKPYPVAERFLRKRGEHGIQGETRPRQHGHLGLLNRKAAPGALCLC